MVFGLNGLAIRAPDAKLPPNCTELRFGAFGTSPGPRDQKKIPLTLIGIGRALYIDMLFTVTVYYKHKKKHGEFILQSCVAVHLCMC